MSYLDDDEDDPLLDEEVEAILAKLSKNQKKTIVLEDEVDEFDKEYEDELTEISDGFKII